MNPPSSLENKIMKTLNRTITSQFYIDPNNGFTEIQRRWKEAVDQGTTLTPSHHLLYAVLRGKDYRRAFTPITSKVKLENGQQPFTALANARANLRSAFLLFDGLLSSLAPGAIMALLPWIGASTLPEEYSSNAVTAM